MRYTIASIAVLLSAGFSLHAHAEIIRIKDGSASVDLSATQMSRLVVQGEKITAVRTLDAPDGPQLLVQNDPATGDVFVGFDGDTAGRTFSLYVTTDHGETAQVLLHPGDGPARTIELVPERKLALEQSASGLRTSGYTETVSAFMKLMFNNQTAEGVTYEPANEKATVSGRLRVRTIGYFKTSSLRGIVLFVTNEDSVPRALTAEQFLVPHVIAAGVSNELLQPGESARVYIEEEAR